MIIYRLLKDKDSILYDEEFGFIFIPLILMLDIICLPFQPFMYFIFKYIDKVNEEGEK